MKLLRKRPKNLGRRRRVAVENTEVGQQTAHDASSLTSFGNRIRPSEQEMVTASQKQAPKANMKQDSGLQRIGHLVLLVAIVASAVNILTLSTSPKILPLTTGGDTTFLHSQATYQQAASQLLASSFWNRNKVTINATEISQKLLEEFPELTSANVTLPLLAHRPIVYVQSSQPALILATASGSFILNDSGKALLRTTQLPAGKHLNIPLVTDQSGISVELNHQALSSNSVGFIQTVIAQLNAKHLSIASISLPPEASELDVWLVGQPYFIKFNLQQNDSRQQVGTFLAVLSQLQGQGISPSRYVDVRVSGRAYYQ